MHSIDKRNFHKAIGFYSVFGISGLILAIFLSFLTFSGILKRTKMDSQITSSEVEIIHDDEGAGMPVYTYNVNGKDYKCNLGYYSDIYTSKQKIVHYKSSNPADCSVEGGVFNVGIIVGFLIAGVFIFLGLRNILKVAKQIKRVEELSKFGKLIKGLPYFLKNTGMSKFGKEIKVPVVSYTLPSGTVVDLEGDPRFDYKITDSDGCVDLLIDENNPSNYFIDFNIN